MLGSDNPYSSPPEPRPLPVSWAGQYTYDPIYGIDLPPISFRMSWVRQRNGKIQGTVNDGPESGMQETGVIRGFFRDDTLEFTKYMPVETIINEDGSSTKSNSRHPPIHYSGKYDPHTQTLEGIWYIVHDDSNGECSGNWIAQPAESFG